jgi:predicted RNA binding protein YcfA (HicA-like mRNA interferase family)
MGKLLNQKRAIKLLSEHGWIESIGGNHNVKMIKPEIRPVTLPKHKGQDYGRPFTLAILKQAGIDPDEL